MIYEDSQGFLQWIEEDYVTDDTMDLVDVLATDSCCGVEYYLSMGGIA